jgi:superfamily II DNA helicase RecQ
MQIKTFTVPIMLGEQVEEEMNRFLRGHRVVDIASQLVSDGHGSYWCFCIRYLDRASYPPGPENQGKVDYRKVLDEPTFKRFALLREVRKELAQEDAVPAFAILTDEELAGVAKLAEPTVANLQSIKGIGEKKAAKYGEKLIDLFLKRLKHEAGGAADAANSGNG